MASVRANLTAVIAVSAVVLATVSAPPAEATTTTLTVPTAPYLAVTNGTYRVADAVITPAATSVLITLPVGAWQGRGITSVTYNLLVDGPTPVLTGTAPIVGDEARITLPPGFATAHPAPADGYILMLSGTAARPPSVPAPTRAMMAACDTEATIAYELSLTAFIPFSSNPGASAVTTSLNQSNVVPDSPSGSDVCYWVTPPSRLAVAPGDTVRFTASTALFTGTWNAQVGLGGGGDGAAPVNLTTAASGDSTVMSASIPVNADLSAYSDPRISPSLALSQYNSGGTSINIGTPVTVTGWSPTVARIAGSDRFDTSVAISNAGYPSTAPVVVVATGMNYPDALAAGPAAARLGGPLLLTAPGSLPVSVSTEIKRLKPGKILIVGGPSAVSPSVERNLAKLAGSVVRIAGSDRFDTARKIVSYAFPRASKAYIATAMNYPDALSAAAAAGSQGAPVLLVNGTAGAVDTASTTLLSSLGVHSAVVVGGTNAVSPGIMSSLTARLGAANVARLAGSDRFETSVLVAHSAFSSSTTAYVATGLQFPDALAGSALAASKHAPLFTSMPTCLSAGAKQEMQRLGVATVTLIGGTNALSTGVARLAVC